jgi:hypothetical protein
MAPTIIGAGPTSTASSIRSAGLSRSTSTRAGLLALATPDGRRAMVMTTSLAPDGSRTPLRPRCDSPSPPRTLPGRTAGCRTATDQSHPHRYRHIRQGLTSRCHSWKAQVPKTATFCRSQAGSAAPEHGRTLSSPRPQSSSVNGPVPAGSGWPRSRPSPWCWSSGHHPATRGLPARAWHAPAFAGRRQPQSSRPTPFRGILPRRYRLGQGPWSRSSGRSALSSRPGGRPRWRQTGSPGRHTGVPGSDEEDQR